MAIVKIPFRLRVMGFSNNRLLFLFSWEREFSTGNSGTEKPLALHHEQTISIEEMHTLITLNLWLALWLLIYSGWLINSFIIHCMVDYIRSHVCLCTVLLYSKASNLCYLLTVGRYTVACKPKLYVYALMMESK